MDQGCKHFSHLHNLVMHQMPEGVQVTCSCCNSSGTGTVYVCWQCNFFVHAQCFKATRSLKHPSHPLHPLTLVPYPTYPSNSFYCNSCQSIGTGFSYSCADCEFDLHVQCACPISEATSFQELVQVHNSNMENNVPFVVQYHSSAHDQASVSIPTSLHTPIPTVQRTSKAQNAPSVPTPMSFQHLTASVQYPSMAHTGPSGGQDHSIPQHGVKDEAIKHFTHPHNLSLVNLNLDKQNEVVCSGCKVAITGRGYSCFEPNCNFHLHESCFHLEKQIHHKSHPEHPLRLLPYAPYPNKNGEFYCNACFGYGTGFTYNCSICKFDLHITCATLPETVNRPDHEHVLKLFYSCPVQGEEYSVSCDVCYGSVQKEEWGYYCESCDFGTHLGCVDCEKGETDSVVDAQMQLQMLQLQMQSQNQRLQFQMQMSQQQAQFVSSLGKSMLNSL
ncbi:hypothetical protein QVD17_20262 [Tagetes erecta]|uniref:Zinc finger PHD-type domain-containing protein n=1 Tax=Tagetes erecta TaxID=13708 RepID=A0AAD8NY10_TARER|nr:hypothetical protein QVD17_20262 [Tagetes erecta]